MSGKIEITRDLAQWALDSVDECIMRNEPEKLEELRALLAAPPELAELQATIAHLRDELAELQDDTDNHISAIERERVELQSEIERLKGFNRG